MTKPLKVQVVKPGGNIVLCISCVTYCVALYYLLHPGKYESHWEAFIGYLRRLEFRAEVARTFKAISDLPETDANGD